MAAKKKTVSKSAAKASAKAPAKPAPKKAPKPAPPVPRPPRAPGERRYWLVKTEPEVFSFADLWASKNRTTGWGGVRNYQARNMLRDEFEAGDGIVVYHSSTTPPSAVGAAVVARRGYADPTQFDPGNEYFDAGSSEADPRWFQVDVRAVAAFPTPLALETLREVPALAKMTLLQRGSRLSVQPVSADEWRTIVTLAGLDPKAV